MAGRLASSGGKVGFNAPIPSLVPVKSSVSSAKTARTVMMSPVDDFNADELIGLLTASRTTLGHSEDQTTIGKRKRNNAGDQADEARRKRANSGELSDEIAECTDLCEEYDPEIEELFNSPDVTVAGSGSCDGGSGQEEVSASHGTDIAHERICRSDSLTPPYEGVELCLSQSEEVDSHGPPPKSHPMLPTPSPPPSTDTLAQQRDNYLVASIDVLQMSKNIAEVKSRILSTHSVITTYTAMKSAYIHVCALSKSVTRQLELARRRISELERKNSQLAGKLEGSNAKVEELKAIIRSLPDQGEVLRNIAQLEMDNIKKAKEIQRLRLQYGENDESAVGSGS
ncbi:hypothetical protein V1525DRAFT_456138 [Lipomyces kononenkoae]|uniref:Uncharacterized protein n=1 Tax=Lipomyces kononenkoae TaxID=34357 RepID=A0ACC3T2I7_LIPKO